MQCHRWERYTALDNPKTTPEPCTRWSEGIVPLSETRSEVTMSPNPRSNASLIAVVSAAIITMPSAMATPYGEAEQPHEQTLKTPARDCTTWRPPMQPGPIDLPEVTEAEGLLEPLKGMMVHAAATADVNGDGWLDLFVGTFADRPLEDYLVRGSDGRSPDRLLLGGPDGFSADDSFPEMYGRTSGSVFTDLDNDGDLDLVLARNYKNLTGSPHITNDTLILRNDDGQFTPATVLSDQMRGRTIAVLDYDADGLLDLFIVDDHYGADGNSVLFRNLGDLEFADVTTQAGLPAGMTGLSAASADLNGDSRPDLLLSGTQRTASDGPGRMESQVARLFLNTGGQFSEVDASNFTFPTQTPTDEVAGLAVGDLNRDGRPDVVQGSHIHDSALLEEGVPALKVYLHRGLDADGVPQFEDVTEGAGIPDANTRVPHVEIVDLDADGWPDLVSTLSRGDGTKTSHFRNLGVPGGELVFEVPSGLGDERTTPPTWSQWEELGLDRYWANGAAADYDRDGDIDIFVSEWFQELPSRLFANETNTGQRGIFVSVDSHQAAVGATVEVYCPGGLGRASALVGSRPLTLEVGYGAGLPAEVFFGVGGAPTVDLRVTLPNNTGVIERRGVRTGQHVVLGVDDAVVED